MIPRLSRYTLSWITIFSIASVIQTSGQNTILWRVTDSVSNNTSYIIGTFHQMGSSFIDSLPVIGSRLYESDLAIFESTDDVESTRRRIMARAESASIEKGLGTKYYLKLLDISRSWKVDIKKLKPIEIRWKLQQEYQKNVCKTAGPADQWDHLDSYLIHLAKQKGIPVMGLETDSLQLTLIDREYKSPDWKQERKFVKLWIDRTNDPKPDPRLCAFSEKYRRFDLDYAFDKPCDDDVLLNERNREWLKILPALLRDNSCFIAVGYSHLRNTCGLLEQLKEAGFVVEPVAMKE